MWALAPGACIAALGAAFALLNYAFDEIGNPALRPVRRRSLKRRPVPPQPVQPSAVEQGERHAA
jgi:peptide/nickel transport system permease protein